MPRSKSPEAYAYQWHELIDVLSHAHPDTFTLPFETYKKAQAGRNIWYALIRAFNVERDNAQRQKDYAEVSRLNARLRVMRSYEAIVDGKYMTLRGRDQSDISRTVGDAVANLREQYADTIAESEAFQHEMHRQESGETTQQMQSHSLERDKALQNYINEKFISAEDLIQSAEEHEQAIQDDDYIALMTQNMEKK